MSDYQGGSTFSESCAPEADQRGSVQYPEQFGRSQQCRSLDAAWISMGWTVSAVVGGTDGNGLVSDRSFTDELQ